MPYVNEPYKAFACPGCRAEVDLRVTFCKCGLNLSLCERIMKKTFSRKVFRCKECNSIINRTGFQTGQDVVIRGDKTLKRSAIRFYCDHCGRERIYIQETDPDSGAIEESYETWKRMVLGTGVKLVPFHNLKFASAFIFSYSVSYILILYNLLFIFYYSVSRFNT